MIRLPRDWRIGVFCGERLLSPRSWRRYRGHQVDRPSRCFGPILLYKRRACEYVVGTDLASGGRAVWVRGCTTHKTVWLHGVVCPKEEP